MVKKGKTYSVFVGREAVGFRYFLHLSRNIESKPLYCCIVKFVHFFSFVIKDLKNVQVYRICRMCSFRMQTFVTTKQLEL